MKQKSHNEIFEMADGRWQMVDVNIVREPDSLPRRLSAAAGRPKVAQQSSKFQGPRGLTCSTLLGTPKSNQVLEVLLCLQNPALS